MRFSLLVVALALIATPANADTVTLRPQVEASGAAITLGDVFDGAGALSGRAIAPAPPPGQVTTLSAAVLVAAASAAGLEWTPPAGLNGVRVVRPAGMRATLPAQAQNSQASYSNGPVADAAIRRGDAVTLVYQAPGITLSVRTRAAQDGAIGQSIRLINLTSNRQVDATVTGPGAASASAP